MTENKKKEYAQRMIESNRTQLVVILYELIFTYFDDAIKDYNLDNWEATKIDLDNAERVIRRLMDDLNFNFPISKQLFSLYRYALKELAMVRVKRNLSPIKNARKVLMDLYEGFAQVAKEDHSEPMMQNIQNLKVGMTYSKNNEEAIYDEHDPTRGFYA